MWSYFLSDIQVIRNNIGCEFVTTNFDEFLDLGMDAIVIAMPHYLHAPYAIKAMEEEIHVFCEKPMATTMHETDAMISAARLNDCKLGIGHQRRFSPDMIKI